MCDFCEDMRSDPLAQEAAIRGALRMMERALSCVAIELKGRYGREVAEAVVRGATLLIQQDMAARRDFTPGEHAIVDQYSAHIVANAEHLSVSGPMH